VILPSTLDLDEEELAVVVPKGREDGLRQVVGYGLRKEGGRGGRGVGGLLCCGAVCGM